MASDTVKIAAIENAVEAGLVSAVLTERTIPHTIRSYHDSAYDGIFQLQRGWGAIYAPTRYRDEVLEILADIRSEALSETQYDDLVPVRRQRDEDGSMENSNEIRRDVQDGKNTKHHKDD